MVRQSGISAGKRWTSIQTDTYVALGYISIISVEWVPLFADREAVAGAFGEIVIRFQSSPGYSTLLSTIP